jgi:putative phosphoribosyl transferase
MFRDRAEAGRMLGAEIAALKPREPVVLALPRGGVPVACEVAAALNSRWRLWSTATPDVVLNREIVEAYGLDDDEIAALVARERPELERRRAVYRSGRAPVSVKGKTVIVVDDGAATGTTMKVVARAIRRRSPATVILALPVASTDAVSDLEKESDKVVCLSQPPRFRALGYHYRDFHQIDDAEVLDLLATARSREASRRSHSSETPHAG